MQNHEEEDVNTRPPIPWGLIGLGVLCCLVVGVGVRYVWKITRPIPRPLVAQIAIIDCSPSMKCPSDTYFDQALGIEGETERASGAKRQATGASEDEAPKKGLSFACPSQVQGYQIANSLGVKPFTREIRARGFGEYNDRCRNEIKKSREDLKTWVHETTAQKDRPGETNLLELLQFISRPSPEYRLHIILATDARQSTAASGIDMDKTPLTEKNFDETLKKALYRVKELPKPDKVSQLQVVKLPELDNAQIIFVLPGVSADAKTANSLELLKRFWTEYVHQVAPTAKPVRFSTQLVPFDEEVAAPEKTEDSGRNKS